MDHWRRGHKQICKEIHRGGNAEKYHADKKYKEAVAVAVAKCAERTFSSRRAMLRTRIKILEGMRIAYACERSYILGIYGSKAKSM